MAAAVELQKQQKYILVLANHKTGSRFRKHVQELVDYLKEFVQLNYNVVYIGDRTCRGPQPTDDPVVWWNSIINDKEILQNHIILVVVGPERFSETALASLAASPPKFVHNNPVELQLMGLQPTNPGGVVPIVPLDMESLLYLVYVDRYFVPRMAVAKNGDSPASPVFQPAQYGPPGISAEPVHPGPHLSPGQCGRHARHYEGGHEGGRLS